MTPQDTAELVRVSGMPDVSREELKKWYGLMHLARVLDDKAPNYLKQGLGWSYHAPCAGHDAIQLALGMTFRPNRDYLFPYYRDLTTCVAAGLTAEEILLNGMSKAADVASGGRHMSNHFAKAGDRDPERLLLRLEPRPARRGSRARRQDLPQGRDRLLLRRRVLDVRGILLRGRQRRLARAAAGRLRRPGQRLRHLRPQGRPDGQRVRLRQLQKLQERPGHSLPTGWTSSTRSARCARRSSTFARAPAARSCTPRCVRIHSHSNSDRHELYRSPEELAAARDGGPAAALPAHAARERAPHRGRARLDRGSELADLRDGRRRAPGRRRIRRPTRSSSSSSPKPWVAGALARRRPRRHRRGRCPLVQALNQTLKEEFRAKPGHLHLGPGRRQQGQGRHLQRLERHAAGVRQDPRLQRPDRRGLHPRNRRRLLALRTTRSASSARAPSSPTTSGRRPSRWSRCPTSTGAPAASSCPT